MDISAGSKHSMVLSGNGCLYTFGFGEQGQLGHKDSDNQKKPKFVKDFDGIRI
jgi:alpha-tubulin suppressor-like RCC1 family protein